MNNQFMEPEPLTTSPHEHMRMVLPVDRKNRLGETFQLKRAPIKDRSGNLLEYMNHTVA